MRAGFSYYRALQQDVAHNEALLKQNGKLKMPVLALGGGKGFGRGIETLESLQRVSTDVRGGVIDDCGHWMQEEKPDEVLKQVQEFLSAGCEKQGAAFTKACGAKWPHPPVFT